MAHCVHPDVIHVPWTHIRLSIPDGVLISSAVLHTAHSKESLYFTMCVKTQLTCD